MKLESIKESIKLFRECIWIKFVQASLVELAVSVMLLSVASIIILSTM